MGRIFTVELEGRTCRCRFCNTHLALAQDLISRSFHSRCGKAYLFNNIANITVGDLEERVLAFVVKMWDGNNAGEISEAQRRQIRSGEGSNSQSTELLQALRLILAQEEAADI